MNRLIPVVAALALATAYLTYRVVVLKREVRRAEYFVQSGLTSVQRACAPAIDLIRTADPDAPWLWHLGKGCFGQTDGIAESDEWVAVRFDPRRMADLIHEKLRVRRRLPWRSLSAPTREEMPVDYYDERPIPAH